MRVRLKGINKVRKRLADGTAKTFYYAWRGKGAPLLVGKPGTPEFIAIYNEAVRQKVPTPNGKLLFILNAYQQSQDFLTKRDRTREDYVEQIKKIEAKFKDFPLSGLKDRRSRDVFLTWRDELALKSRRQADYAYTVLAIVLSWAYKRGKIDANPCEKGGRIYDGNRREMVWTDEQEAALLATHYTQFHAVVVAAADLGQREGDLIRLTWSAYDGTHIRLRQRKSLRHGKRPVYVTIPVSARLKAVLDKLPRQSPTIFLNSEGKPWTEDGFRSSFRKACAAAGIMGVTFNDLRGTAVTRLGKAGCSEAEIATITGHSLKDVRSILDAHYLHRDPEMGDNAIAKLEDRRARTKRGDNLQTGLQTGLDVLK